MPARGTELAFPFALVGFVGGAFVGTLAHDGWVIDVFAIVTAFVAGAWGWFLTRHRRTHGGAGTGFVVVGTLLAGSANGALILGGLVVAHASPVLLLIGVCIGIFVGAIFALPFIPVLAHVAHVDELVGIARHGTMIDHADRRGVWAVCFGWIGCSLLLGATSRWTAGHMVMMLVVAAVVIFGIALLVLADVRAWMVLRRPAVDAGDFGLGPLETFEHAPTTYRAPAAIVLSSDTALARAQLVRALRRDVLALLVACTGAALFVFTVGVKSTVNL